MPVVGVVTDHNVLLEVGDNTNLGQRS